MIWVIANKAEEDGSFPTYKYYKKAFGDGEIDIFCASQDDDFSFLKREDIVIMRTRDENINKRVSEAQSKIGFISTLESPLTNHLTYDKNAVKTVLREAKMPFPESINMNNIKDGMKCFVKPLYGENSTGIDRFSICFSKEEVLIKCEYLLNMGLKPLAEEYIDGFDVTTAVFNIDGLKTYSIKTYPTEGEIQSEDTKRGFDFLSMKYDNRLVDYIARMIFHSVGAKHHLRIDFRVKNGVPYVIDINMIPGLAPNGYMSMCMKEHGVDYLDFIRMIVDTAS